MKLLLQRVSRASVTVDEKIIGKIGKGVLLLIGFTHQDSQKDLPWFVNKVLNLRIFPDENDKMNRSLLDVQGEILAVSQFTLYGNCKEGRRPSFTESAPPEIAKPLYEEFVRLLREAPLVVQEGEFGAKMEVELINDGPITLSISNN